MNNIVNLRRLNVLNIKYFTFFIGLISYFLFAPFTQTALAAINDPNTYTIYSYDYIPAFNAKFISSVPDIHNLDTVSITYEDTSNMDVSLPPELNAILARLFYITDTGTRQFVYHFFDENHSYVPPPYTWTKSGHYEIDLEGYVDTSTTSTYLTTIKFEVMIKGGPAPTCTLTATPNVIDVKNGEEALLEWSSNGAHTASIDQEIGTITTTGSIVVTPNATTTYTATFVGDNGTTTCITTVNVPNPVIIPLHEKAASLARQLVNNTEAYLWGGKGWDYDINEFTTPKRILSGYTYYNPDTSKKETGIGVDCSGLITWAFNRSYNALAGFNKNYVRYVNADGMFRDYQSDPVDEADLRPGDTLSFDWNNDGRMDHVAMYVGESGGYDVVNARSKDFGIETQNMSTYTSLSNFTGFRRIHQADTSLTVTTGSPVDLKVTDPEGVTLSATDITLSDEEYIREIPGELYYLELTQGHDGRPEDTIFSPTAKDGTYIIEVIPEPNTDPTNTYSLTVELNGVKTTIVDNETIDTIPENGFALKLNAGEIQSIDPAIKTLLNDLYQAVVELSLSTKQSKNLLSTIESAIDWFDRNRPDQIERKLTKVQNDINRHFTDDLPPTELTGINQQINYILVLLQS